MTMPTNPPLSREQLIEEMAEYAGAEEHISTKRTAELMLSVVLSHIEDVVEVGHDGFGNLTDYIVIKPEFRKGKP